MKYNMNNVLSKDSIYNIPSLQYKTTEYYQKPIGFAPVTRQNIGITYNSQNNINNSIYYSNKNNIPNIPSIYYNSNNPNYQNIKQPQIIKNVYQQNNMNYYDSNAGNVKILPTKYLPTKFKTPKIIYSNIEFAKEIPMSKYTNFEIPLSTPIQQFPNVNSMTKKTEKKEYNIYSQQTPFYSNLQNDLYSTLKNYSYTIPETETYSYSDQQISSHSSKEMPAFSTQQYNTYNYVSQNELQTNNYDVNNKLTDTVRNTNNYNNTFNDKDSNEFNLFSKKYENKSKEISKNIYQEPQIITNNYLINSPKIYKEPNEIKSPKYNSYIYKSPEITYRKDYLFSPIQSPLSNYETRSYNGDDNIDIEEILRLKEENEGYKKQLKELENYEKKAEEIRELRIQVDQLSPIKDKLSEINSLKAQLLELNALKAKIDNLEQFKYKLDKIKETKILKENKGKQIKSKVEKKNKNKQKDKIKKFENVKESEINIIESELNEENEVKGEILHSIEELSLIIKKICKNKKQIILNLIYKATSDSDRAAAFHKKCNNAQSTIVLIETDKGKRFGGYTSVNWKGKGLNKKDKNSFIFSLDNMKVYENIIGEKAIGCYPKFGPIFLGCQIRIYDQAFKNGGTTCKNGLNFNTNKDYVLTGGERKFKIKEIEVYEVIAQ